MMKSIITGPRAVFTGHGITNNDDKLTMTMLTTNNDDEDDANDGNGNDEVIESGRGPRVIVIMLTMMAWQ